jgi:hypothetical protein
VPAKPKGRVKTKAKVRSRTSARKGRR